MHGPITVDVNEDARSPTSRSRSSGHGDRQRSMAALAHLRDEIVPQTVGALPGADAGVTGAHRPLEGGNGPDEVRAAARGRVRLVFAFGLMLVAFRSIVVAAKAVAAEPALGRGGVRRAGDRVPARVREGDLLGFEHDRRIDPVVPLLLFVILFGLSMDYHVLVLGRIREAYDRGATMDDAIAHGIKRTAGVVTERRDRDGRVSRSSRCSRLLIFKQFGVGLAAAILIDATIVRGVLLPASMKLLGEWNWYLPRWLEWLPRFDHDKAEATPEIASTPVSA